MEYGYGLSILFGISFHIFKRKVEKSFENVLTKKIFEGI